MRRAVPNHKAEFSTARGISGSQWLLPISFIVMLKRTFPAA
jgi:hypothetical protein